jgi:CheY-like chemotaxis protein
LIGRQKLVSARFERACPHLGHSRCDTAVRTEIADMMTAVNSISTCRAPRPLRTVAVVSSPTHLELLETVLEVSGLDIIFVESVAHAYSQIKRLTPDLVVLCLSSDDESGCQVLSMLTLDSATSRIPVVTYMARPSEGVSHGVDELDEFRQPVFRSLN